MHPSKPFVSPLYSTPRTRFVQHDIFSAVTFFKHLLCTIFQYLFCLLKLIQFGKFSYVYVSLLLFRTNVTESIAIEGRNLSYSVAMRQGKTLPILRDCSLRIPSGQFWMLLGPNGCGKSTLLKVYKIPGILFLS